MKTREVPALMAGFLRNIGSVTRTHRSPRQVCRLKSLCRQSWYLTWLHLPAYSVGHAPLRTGPVVRKGMGLLSRRSFLRIIQALLSCRFLTTCPETTQYFPARIWKCLLGRGCPQVSTALILPGPLGSQWRREKPCLVSWLFPQGIVTRYQVGLCSVAQQSAFHMNLRA